MCGKWLRPGQPDATVCLKFEHVSDGQTETRARAQEPGDDVPYERREVSFANIRAGGIELAGTLTLPAGSGPFPAAVLI